MDANLPEYIDGLPNISGSESLLKEAREGRDPVFLPQSDIDFSRIKSAFSVALHMQQPLVPEGGPDMQTAELISYLKYMMDHQDIGDNHNAPVFKWCYERMGEFIPELVREGKSPRVLLDYSGCLLHGLRKMGASDTIENLKTITCSPEYRHCVEWLGTPWSHAVAPSTPGQDYRLHVLAWQMHFASIFGLEALRRVKGFSPAEMALPNHPDVAYHFVRTLKDCGYDWVLVQEHTIEDPETGGPVYRNTSHRLVARSASGETATITAVIKTQGSDTKLVAQLQPYYEAKGLGRTKAAGKEIPLLVTQIGDGENGGVMMNEFPSKYKEVVRECSGSATPAVNVTEYLEYLFSLGLREDDFPAAQPVMQKPIWDRLPNGGGKEALNKVIEECKKEDDRFNMDGGSWTNSISWVEGYENVLGPMEKASALFAEKVLARETPTDDPRYRKALFYLLASQTSCYRYWGQGIWTDYAREICRRAVDVITHDF